MRELTRHLILATAGHVDHGKSALVRMLTGTDPDRLPEEKARGVTIDLGFAELNLESPDVTFLVGLIDVPGHEDFIKNMLAGVGSIDAALLVVAADDGWMPQTEEHLQILLYLDVRQIVVALTKIDLTDDTAGAIAAVRARLLDTPYADAAIVPTSTVTGEGIEALKSALAQMFRRLPAPRDYGKPRLPIDRAFSLKGIGAVVTGTLIGGRLSRGQTIHIYPHGTQARIRSVHSHNREITSAGPGSRVALNVPDVALADRRTENPGAIRRGYTITAAPFRPARRLCALLTRSPRRTSFAGKLSAIETGALLQLHHGTTVVAARVRFLGARALELGQQCLAILKTDAPLLAFSRDRFVLREADRTVAGGLILDPLAPALTRRRERYRQAVAELAAHPDDCLYHFRAQLAREPILPRQEVLAQTDFSQAQIDTAIGSTGTIAQGPYLIEQSLWHMLIESIKTRIRAHHTSHPEQTGLPLSDLRSNLANGASVALYGPAKKKTPLLLDSIIACICKGDFICCNGIVRHAAHSPVLPPRLRLDGDKLLKTLAAGGLNPVSRAELCPTDTAHQALRFLIATGQAVELSRDIVVSAEAFKKARDLLEAHLTIQATATVSQLKTLLSSNRRVVVPLLEKFDHDGVTRRDGDLRRLR